VLLIRRAIQPYRGDWALPAGYQEVDEEPAATAIREAHEEAGIVVETISLLDLVFVAADFRKPANVAIYLCRPVGGELRPGADALDAGWFALDALPQNLGFDNAHLLTQRLKIPR
jgi:ADP-ribose pyrophosphatase YjhB (NUDIX family)